MEPEKTTHNSSNSCNSLQVFTGDAMPTLFGGLEAGGTKFNCIVGTAPEEIVAEALYPTTTPEETIGQAVEFFGQYRDSLAAVGIGSFGPVDLDRRSATYGQITLTPKPNWAGTDMVGRMERALGVPVAFDTDVNAATLGEWQWGAAQGLENFIYLTVGTGIGGGGMVGGRLIHGLVHPEMGHIPIPHDHDRDPFPGGCPFHEDCLEGLAAGPALEKRWGRPAETLPGDHPAWSLEAHYLALGLVAYICILSPQRIILGGGVMQQKQLFPLIRREVQQLLNGYVQSPAIVEKIDEYIVPPGLGDKAGVLGSLALGMSR
jgi:fructokinase